jgi:Protein of unknown function (DUF1638)
MFFEIIIVCRSPYLTINSRWEFKMEGNEKPILISCGILRKEIEHLLENGHIDAEVHFLSEKLHMDYNLLDRGLNGAIKKHQKKRPKGVIVVYGDVCLGFNGEMKALMDQYDVVKVDALNCIDCLLGGKGKLLEIDPEHKYLFVNPAFIQFGKTIREKTKEFASREMYNMLDGIVLLDAMGDLDDYQAEIDEISDYTGLPILERKDMGLEGLKNILLEVLDRNGQKRSANQ